MRDLMLLLCCNLLSLAEGGSTTVVAWGVHLPSTCHCSVIVRHHTPHIRHRNGRRNTQKSETIAEVHGNSASICRVFWARSFRLSSGSTHISRFKHRCAAPPCVLRFWCFLLFTVPSSSAATLRPPRSLLLFVASRSRWFTVNICALRYLYRLLQHPRAPIRSSTRLTRA